MNNAEAVDNARIATLTGGAVRNEGERVIKELMRNVELMEQEVAVLRGQAEQLAIDIRKHTGLFADHTAGFVERCQKIIDMMHTVDTVFVESIRPLDSNGPVNEAALLDAMKKAGPQGPATVENERK